MAQFPAVVLLVLLAGSLLADATPPLDHAIELWVREQLGGSAPLRTAMVAVTALGAPATLALVVLIATGGLLVARRVSLALYLLASCAVGTSLPSIVKPLVHRARPDVVAHWTTFDSASFPSGHANDAAVVYASLLVVARCFAVSAALRRYAMAVTVLLVSLIGFSRVYLGVHWPTDVVAGWALGASWVFFSAALADHLGMLDRGRAVAGRPSTARAPDYRPGSVGD